MQEAARLRDPISHSQSLNALIAGAVLGGVLATVVVLTAPVSVPALIGGAAIAGAAVGGAGIGELLGSLSFARSTKGNIAQPGSPNVFINGIPAVRAHLDTVDCADHPTRPVVAQGSSSVYINGQPAARRGDRTACDAVIEAGSPNVFIGGGTTTTDAISPEVPGYVHTTMLLVGLGSAGILFGPTAAILGLAGGMLGGKAMYEVGGALFGEGSDGQKLLAFGGALAGGWAGGKGGAWFDRNYQVQSVGLGANGGNLRVTRRAPPVKPIRENEVTTFGDFKDRSVIGDRLEGHEVWQHANLNERGLATARHASDASKSNPVIALDRDAHLNVSRAQREIDARTQTPTENIESNVKILRDLKVAPVENIDKLHQMAIDHAKSLGY